MSLVEPSRVAFDLSGLPAADVLERQGPDDCGLHLETRHYL